MLPLPMTLEFVDLYYMIICCAILSPIYLLVSSGPSGYQETDGQFSRRTKHSSKNKLLHVEFINLNVISQFLS